MAYKPNPNGKSNRAGIKNSPNAGKTGFPARPIDWDKVGKLASIFCTINEICAIEGISDETLSKRCVKEHGIKLGEWIDQHRGKGRASIRRAQFQLAVENKNPTMLIWLGKQLLGQSDKMEVTEVKENPLVLNYEDPRNEDRSTLLLEVGQPTDDGQRIIEAEGIDSGEDDMVRD